MAGTRLEGHSSGCRLGRKLRPILTMETRLIARSGGRRLIELEGWHDAKGWDEARRLEFMPHGVMEAAGWAELKRVVKAEV